MTHVKEIGMRIELFLMLGIVVTLATGGCLDFGGSGTGSSEPQINPEPALVSLPAQVTSPAPANSATNVITTTQLSWVSATGATSYDVYFGTSSPGTFIGNQAGTTYNPGTLTYNTTYYWRVDPKNSAGTTTGSVWSFQTVANQAPTLTAVGDKIVSEATLLTFVISATDPDGAVLTYSAVGLPAGAAFDASTRTFSWTPSYTQANSYNVTFRATDAYGLFDEETITITVNNLNRAPVLNAIGNQTVNENALLTFAILASDSDSDTLTYSAVGLPAGAVFDAGTRTFSWTPSYIQTGNYNVTFRADDIIGAFGEETITISIGDVNRPPVLSAIGNQTVNENALLTFTIFATDPDSDTLTYSATNLPTGATFDTTTKTFSLMPTYEQGGTYTNITFRATDTGGLYAEEVITITVNDASFTKYAGNPVFQPAQWCAWDCTWFDSVSIISDTAVGLYKIWYLAEGPGDTMLGYATSANGINWTKSTNNPLLSLPLPVSSNDVTIISVIQDGATYKMWYAVEDVGSDDIIYYAASTDGETWTSPNPDGSPRVVITFPNAHVQWSESSLSVILDGTTYRLWIDLWNVGDNVYYYTSSDGLTWTIQNSGNPVITNTSPESNVIKDGGNYKMLGRVLGAAKLLSSADGITWTVVNSNHFGSPASSIINESGIYKRWFNAMGNKIWQATAPDLTTWTNYGSNPVIPSSESINPESHGVYPASVILDSGTYKMWYEYDHSHAPGEFFGYATSADGITWTSSVSNPVLSNGAGAWDEYYIGSPVVIKDGTSYKMWYLGAGPLPFPYGSRGYGLATSNDGVTWTKYGAGPILDRDFGEGLGGLFVIKSTDGIYRMWFERTDGATGVTDIRYAYSSDGITWAREPNPVLSPGAAGSWDEYIEAPTVVFDGTNYRMWYTGSSASGDKKIGETVSPDGITWTKLSVVLSAGAADTWETNGVVSSCILKDGTTYKLWYLGADNKGFERVGLATR